MKITRTQTAKPIRSIRNVLAIGVLAAMAVTIGCNNHSKPSGKPSVSDAKLRPASLEIKSPVMAVPATALEKTPTSAKPPASKLLTFKSRDYGISFEYPWQYSYLNAKAIAKGDASLQPMADGHDGQFTLARVEVPKGFYPDTDFETGYFTLSLNRDLSEQECLAALNVTRDAKTRSENLNGVDFRWVETDSGGHGSASKVRNYVAFANDTCYELEMGVRTRNDSGLAREIDPDQVMRRLDAILHSVTVQQMTMPAATTAEEKPVAQNQ